MPLNSYKSVIYNRKSKTTDDMSVLYEKSFLYDKVMEKLYHNLLVMPKDSIKGVVYIWKFENKKPEMLKLSMDEEYKDWKHEYKSFVGNFTAKSYIYYISTIDDARDKHYRTIIALIPKKSQFDEVFDYLKLTNIESLVKNSFIEKTKEQENHLA